MDGLFITISPIFDPEAEDIFILPAVLFPNVDDSFAEDDVDVDDDVAFASGAGDTVENEPRRCLPVASASF